MMILRGGDHEFSVVGCFWGEEGIENFPKSSTRCKAGGGGGHQKSFCSIVTVCSINISVYMSLVGSTNKFSFI